MSDAVFAALRALLAPYAAEMRVKTDAADNYYVEESWSGPKPQMFGAVQVKKSYVAFHLFPVYVHPELLDAIPPDLRKRMQGKSCFNFKTLEQVATPELGELVRRCYEKIRPAQGP